MTSIGDLPDANNKGVGESQKGGDKGMDIRWLEPCVQRCRVITMDLFQIFRRLRRVKLIQGAFLLFSSVQLITYLNIGGFAASLTSTPSTDTIIYFSSIPYRIGFIWHDFGVSTHEISFYRWFHIKHVPSVSRVLVRIKFVIHERSETSIPRSKNKMNIQFELYFHTKRW